MTPAQLQLADYWATSLHFEALPDYDPDGPSNLLSQNIDVEHAVHRIQTGDDEAVAGTEWFVEIRVSQEAVEDANVPYTFSVKLQGIIVAHPQISGDRLERIVRANGPAMLFGAAREIVRAATGRGPHRAVIIPSTSFLPPADPAADTGRKPAPTPGRSRRTGAAPATRRAAKKKRTPTKKRAKKTKRGPKQS